MRSPFRHSATARVRHMTIDPRIFASTRFVAKLLSAGAIVLCAALLAGCIDLEKPILSDARPVLGQRLNLQFYGLHKGFAQEPEQASYAWSGAHYAHTGGGMKSIGGFTLHPFEAGYFIVQSEPSDRAHKVEYAVMRPLTDGVYHVVAIDEEDADAATRAANCANRANVACRIATQAQLFAFARATMARRKDDGGLAIRLADDAPRP